MEGRVAVQMGGWESPASGKWSKLKVPFSAFTLRHRRASKIHSEMEILILNDLGEDSEVEMIQHV
jgi:hypothetical protein